MNVEVFAADGSLVGSGSYFAVPPGGTRLIATQYLYSFVAGDYLNLSISGTVVGSARLAAKQLICAAWVQSNGTNPGYMNSLPILNRAKQRGQ
jgi:hypothetical protein